MILRRLILLLLVLGSFLQTPWAWAFGFNVEPARIEVSVPPGQRRGKRVEVTNSSENPVHLTLYVRDVVTLPDGSTDYPPAGSTEWSCANWIQFVPAELDLVPGQTKDVRVSLTVPPEASGGHYAILFFESGPSYKEQGIGVNFRIGALVDAAVPNTQRYQAKLAELSFVPPNQIKLVVLNEGNFLIRPKGKIKVLNAKGAKVAQLDLNPDRVGVLPKTLRAIPHTLEKALVPGSYRVKAEVDYGARSLVVGELPITVQ